MLNPLLKIPCCSEEADYIDIYFMYPDVLITMQVNEDDPTIKLEDPNKVRLLAAKLNEMAAEMELRSEEDET